MPEETGKADGIASELTADELKVLSKALKRVETEIFHNVLKRLSVMIGTALTIVLIGGLVNLSSCSSNVENSAVQKLTSDPELRDKVTGKAQEKLQEKLNIMDSKLSQVERDNAEFLNSFSEDLKQLRLMVSRIGEEVGRPNASTKRGSERKGKANEK